MANGINCADALVFLSEASEPGFSGMSVHCSVCHKETKKAGLTLFKWYCGSNNKVWWKNRVMFCEHISWDGDPGCDCCHTIRDGHITCANCAGWDLISGEPTDDMKQHNFTWTDGSNTSCKTYPEIPLKQYECTVCHKIGCFENDQKANLGGWTESNGYQCPNHRSILRKRKSDEISELKVEIQELKELIKKHFA